ncbi:MAG: ASKHA domain-containing protein [Candidatus Omnitrophica bacterium]|nr:ASKHA domain-containing protein [Candidatus Omnitrophota bacterium]
MESYRVTFSPYNKTVEISKATDLLSAALKAGIKIFNSCGGEGVCGRCKVIIKKGEYNTEFSGRISSEERKLGYALACRTTPNSDLIVEVPPESRIEEIEILTAELKAERLVGLYTPPEEIEKVPSVGRRIFTHSPLATKIYLELPPPTLQDNISDLERLYRELRKNREIPIMQTGLANLRNLGKILRESNWRITAILGNRNRTTEIVIIEPGDTTRINFGIALDVGTTTVVAYLVDLNTQEVLGAKASYNRQIDFGEDVISRIIVAESSHGLEKLHHAVVDTINDLIQKLAQDHGISLNDIYAVTVAGNTTMIHLLLKVDPIWIRREPYVPTANFIPVIRAVEVGIKIHPRALLSCIPAVSSYVGGDITAGVIASGMHKNKEISMFIDLGTNGEIVLGNHDWLVCCSTSAGPCFEGGGVKWGIRAMKGAIQRIEIRKDNKVKISTIGDTKPKGICGSGIIDVVGELLRNGLIERSGKIKLNGDKRIVTGEEIEFIIVYKDETAVSQDITITESDIKNVIHSKGAIYTGAEVLLKHTGLSFEDVKYFFISGGLGTYLDIEKAVMIGLLPDLPRERFIFLGNSSLTGAKICLLSQEAYEEIESIARKMTYIDLSTNAEFMNNYSASLFLPHTDIDKFPSIKKILSKQITKL